MKLAITFNLHKPKEFKKREDDSGMLMQGRFSLNILAQTVCAGHFYLGNYFKGNIFIDHMENLQTLDSSAFK